MIFVFSLLASSALPLNCTYTYTYDSYRNEIVRQVPLNKDDTVCLIFKENGLYNGYFGTAGLNFVNDTYICLWVTYDDDNYTLLDCRNGNVTLGAVSLGSYRGIISFRAKEHTYINVGVTNYLSWCDYKILSTHNSDRRDIDIYIGYYGCYYNALPGIINHKMYANTTINNCYYSYYPYDPFWTYLTRGTHNYPISEELTSVLLYRCSNSYRRTRTELYADSKYESDYYVKALISNNPGFYASRSYWADVLVILMVIGIIIGSIFLFLFIFFVYMYFKDRDQALQCLTTCLCCNSDCCPDCPSGCHDCQRGGQGCVIYCCECQCCCRGVKVFDYRTDYNV